MPEFMETVGIHYHDFNKRIACIRELAEETNLFLLADKDGKLPKGVSLEKMITQYSDRFAHFCKDFGIYPQIDKLYAHCRIGTPAGLPFNEDTQYYVYVNEGNSCVLKG